MPMRLRLVLDESAFAALVAGRAITMMSDGVTVEIILSDIGFRTMERAIERAEMAVGAAEELTRTYDRRG